MVTQLFNEMEINKMCPPRGSTWHLISLKWLNAWKNYVAQDDSASGVSIKGSSEHPGPISNEDLIDERAAEAALKDPKDTSFSVPIHHWAKEEEHFTIVNDAIWEYLSTLYGGKDIVRRAVSKEEEKTEDEECFIELFPHEVKLYFIPKYQKYSLDKPTPLLISRKATVRQLREKIVRVF